MRSNLFRKGDSVRVADLSSDTAIVDGSPVSKMSSSGQVVEYRNYPPEVDPNSDTSEMDPSPHVLVHLKDRSSGKEYDVWFHAARVEHE